MAGHRRRLAVIAGGALALASCNMGPQPGTSAANVEALPMARDCAASLPTFGRFYYPGNPLGTYMPPNGSIRTSNDGGWCWTKYVFYWGQQPIVPGMRVSVPPQHGEVRTGAIGTELRFAYRPVPGFTGEDYFEIRLTSPDPWDVPVRVTVTQ
jgi:hypothetical protein